MQTSILFMVGLLLCLQSNAQNYHLQVQHLTMREGLPNYYVRHLMIDQQGFARIATYFGYCRYDGYEVEVYKQPEGLHNNRQISSYQDVNGLIWFNYFSGAQPYYFYWQSTPASNKLLEIYNPLTCQAVSFEHYFANKAPFSIGEIAAVIGDKTFHIWIITSNRTVWRYDGQFQKMGILPPELARSTNPINQVFDHAYNTLAVVHQGELYLTNRWDRFLYKLTKAGTVETSKAPEPIAAMWVDTEGTWWAVPRFSAQLWRKNGNQDWKITPLPGGVTQNYQPEFVELYGASDAQGRVWIIRNRTLYVLDKSGKILQQQATSDANLNLDNVSHFLIDKQDNVWISTGNGVYILSLKKRLFTNYLQTKGVVDTRRILVDEQGTIWVNQAGLYRIEPGKAARKVATPHMLDLVSDGQYLWCSGYNAKLFRFRRSEVRDNQLLPYDSLDLLRQYPHSNDLVLHRSRKTGKIWVGGKLFFGTLDGQTMTFQPHQDSNLLKSDINCFFENETGIWIGTDQGIFLLDESKGIIAHYKKHFINKSIVYLYEDKAGIFWIATRGGGLLRWDRQRYEVQAFTMENGLSNNVIYAVYEDDFSYLWLPSNYGLMRFHKITHQVHTFLPEDGLSYHEFNHTAHARAPDGRLFFGGLKGITAFHPQDFTDYGKQPAIPLQITRVQRLNLEGVLQDETKHFLTANNIVLPPGERSLVLRFALLNFSNSLENKYAYRIEGLDQDWTYISENYVRLNNLPYGHYILHLKAQDKNGRWSQQELHVSLDVKRPFYLQWWFITFMIILVIVLVLLERRQHAWLLKRRNLALEEEVARRTAIIQRQAETLKALDEQKSNFFLNIAHELRTPLTLIASPISLFLERESNDTKIAAFLRSIKKNTQYLLDLVEGILNLSKLDAKQLQLEEEPVHCHSLLGRIFAMYESYASMHRLHYNFTYQANTNLQLLLDVSKFEKIVHNLLSNAVKFTTEEGLVELRVWETKHHLRLWVRDTGKGIPAEDLPHVFERYFQSKQPHLPVQGGSGIGLAIAWEYAQLMSGVLTVESEVGKGSTFTLSIPKKLAPQRLESPVLPDLEIPYSPPPVAADNKPYTLLLVDDNVEMQKLLRNIVEPQYGVLQAENGVAALKILHQHPVDGIITDLMMPQMDGFGLIERLKSHDDWRLKPVLVLTARANEQDKLQALRMGIDDYLYKPFSPQELLVRTQNLLHNYHNRMTYKTEVNGHNKPLSADENWLQTVETYILQLLRHQMNFNIIDVAKQMYMSDRHFHRKIQQLTGLTANDYIKEIRLQKAKQLLEAKVFNTVSEVAYAVGFSSASYFTKVYTERFGKKPSEYL
jgi:signal transduction histidine kinase/DNA-binding response OmpR family regulator/ligand-binding sensor domain-containing protein